MFVCDLLLIFLVLCCYLFFVECLNLMFVSFYVFKVMGRGHRPAVPGPVNRATSARARTYWVVSTTLPLVVKPLPHQ